ncbi:MAG: magnesium transporter [Pirellulales bacterium]
MTAPNPLYLPELREMLAEDDHAQLSEFCSALHPARIAEFMEGLAADEIWRVLQHAEPGVGQMIFGYFELPKQIEIMTYAPPEEMARFIGEMPSDDRVDLLDEVDPEIVAQLLPLLPAEERRDIQRLRSYPEQTAGAIMTTDYAGLSEKLTVGQAVAALGKQAEDLETIYYIYVVDDENHLRGVLSARNLMSMMGKPETLIGDIMDRGVVSVDVTDDQEVVADKVAHYDLLAIPVVDSEHHMLGIVTHDDVIDVVREEAMEDAHRSAAVAPLGESYLTTSILTLTWKRGIWLFILFFGALATTFAMERYIGVLEKWEWLVLFIPLIISSGGNSGSQSATLIITALTAGQVTLGDWWQVARREMLQGLLLGGLLGICGFFAAYYFVGWRNALVLPLAILLVVFSGTLIGAVLPLLFRRLGLDPALMSNPFVAGIMDVLGIVVYLNVALWLLV